MTNRTKFLKSLSNAEIAEMIDCLIDNRYECEEFCPLAKEENSTCNGSLCSLKLEKWLGEKA